MDTNSSQDKIHISKANNVSFRTVWKWIVFNYTWLIPLVISLVIGAFWLRESLSYTENQVTRPINMGAYGISGLKIEIQYPRRLTRSRDDDSHKRIIIIPSGNVDLDLEPIVIAFRDVSGVMNFVNSDSRITDGTVTLNTINGKPFPNELRIILADIPRTNQINSIFIETFISTKDQPEFRVPSLKLKINIENSFERILRTILQSTFGGTFAVLTLTVALFGFVRRQYITRVKIQPYELEIERLTGLRHWDRVAEACHKILEIDPLYDDIGTRYHNAQDKAHQQDSQLGELYEQAQSEIEEKHWIEAKYRLFEISQIRPDYRDVKDLLKLVDRKHENTKAIDQLFRDASYANLVGDLGKAIKCYEYILELDPENTEVKQALTETQNAIKKYGTDRLTAEAFNRMKMLARRTVTDTRTLIHFLTEEAVADEDIAVIAELSVENRRSIIDALHDERVTARINAIRVLAKIGDQQAYQHLRNVASEDRNPDVRQAAEQVLIQIVDIEDLIAQLYDSSTWLQVRPAIVTKSNEAVPYLIPLLEQRTPIWQRAAGILVDIGEYARPALVKMMPSDNPIFEERIRDILNAIQETFIED